MTSPWRCPSKCTEARVSCCGKWRQVVTAVTHAKGKRSLQPGCSFRTGIQALGSHLCVCSLAVSATNHVPRGFSATYLVVDVVSAHGDGVHDKLPAVVVAGGAEGDVVGVVLRAEIVAQLVGGDQIGLLRRRNNNTHTL